MGVDDYTKDIFLNERDKVEIFLELAIQGSNDGIWTWDITDNKIYYAGTLRSYYDADSSPAHIPYDFLAEFICPLDIDAFYNYLKKYLEKEIPHFKVECRFGNSPEYEPVLVQGKAMWNEKGEPLLMAGSYTLIADFKKTANEHNNVKNRLKETSALLNVIFDNIPDPICIKDIEDKIQQCNSAALSFWGKSRGEIIGKTCEELEICSDPCKESATRKALKYKKPIKIQKYIYLQSKWVDIMAYPVLDENNNVKSVIEHIKDITELKRVEMILQKNIKSQKELIKDAEKYDKIKTEFFADISHEIKTPLNVILSSLQLLEIYYTSTDAVAKYIKVMKRNCYRLLRLLNNLIDITKIESGYYKLHLQNNDIVDIIKQITSSVSQYIENKAIRFEFQSKVDKKIMAFDTEKIDRIMLNLLSNAAKFTPRGGKIMVNIEQKGNSIIVFVEDTGIGIPLEKQKVIFERFGQVDSEETRENEGSGIGLSLVKSLVEMHGGTIGFSSMENKGSKFIIELPIKVADEEINESSINDTKKIKNIETLNIELSDIYS